MNGNNGHHVIKNAALGTGTEKEIVTILYLRVKEKTAVHWVLCQRGLPVKLRNAQVSITLLIHIKKSMIGNEIEVVTSEYCT